MQLLREKKMRRWLVAGVVMLGLIGLGTHVFGYPTHYYEGRALSAGEFLALVEAGQELRCVQQPRETLWDSLHLAGAYACYDSAQEQDASQ